MNMKTKFFRVAQEGDTIDGRNISREQIEQMAKNYQPKTYNARVWLEHFRGLVPGSIFDALGDVTEVKAEVTNGKMGLYAQLQPLPELIQMNQKGQKLHTSIEMSTNFAGTNEAYLVGLAVTDTPASLGTEVLSFSAGQSDIVTGATHEIELEFSQEQTSDDKPNLFTRIKEMLGNNKAEGDQRFSDMENAIEEIAKTVGEESVTLQTHMSKAPSPSMQEFKTLQDSNVQLAAQLKDITEQLSKNTPNFTPRPPASGGDGQQMTDC